ncbi:GLCAK2, partial [Symbiodinium sp. KB8]
MGNPSDTCGGKTVSATVSNFWADVWLTASTSISFKPHPLYDPHEFGSLRELAFTTGRDGYSGAQRLFLATLRKLFVMAEAAGIDLPAKGFKVHFDTNIPRQVGLAGSSALITAFIKCLFRYWKLSKEQLESLPSLVLAVELQELNISAGLQDRVIQVYQGIVHMDFSPELMKGVSYGRYTELDPRPLPPLFLAYTLYPSDSGRIHAPIKQRWEQKDAE